jgi:hypothetical protein
MLSTDVAASVSPASVTHTLGAALERDRLERRVRRMTVAVDVLRLREHENRREPGAPRRHLGQVIADFEAQIEAMTTRVRDLAANLDLTNQDLIEIERGAR